MRVWVLENYSHGEVYIFDESTNLLEVPYIKDELGYLEKSDDEFFLAEREEFIRDVERGATWLSIEERFEVELQEVKHYD
jgi:hypothetical protein